MESTDEIIIKDSCILFDLIDLSLIDDFFRLELRVFTTPHVMAEVNDETQLKIVSSYITTGKLIIDADGSDNLIFEIYGECIGLSFADSSVLELAIRKNGIVLSSDKSLRNESIRRNLKVRGLLWVIEALVEKQIISTEQALTKLRFYPEVNSRAPKDEIAKLIQKFRK